MRNALILHGTNNSLTDNWFPWLKEQLEKDGYHVWSPNLPGADKPSISRYNKFIFANDQWSFSSESILIGHSSGAVALLGLLQALPEGVIVDTCILVGAFKDDLGWDALTDLFTQPLNFEIIKSKAKRFVFVHSDNDPYCPLDHAIYLREQLGGELHIYPGQKHFSIKTFGEKYKTFPVLVNLLNTKI